MPRVAGWEQRGRPLGVRGPLTTWGIPRRRLRHADGSGLSRYNYVTPQRSRAVLEHMFKDPPPRCFRRHAADRREGRHIASRMRRTRAEGNAVAKTGSIANVRSLSGFVRTRDGEMVVFSILANDFVIPRHRNWIADLGVETLSNFTRR